MSALRFAGPIGLGLHVLLVAGCATDQGSLLRPIPSTYSPELMVKVMGREDFDFWAEPEDSYVKRSAIELGDEAVPSLVEALSNAANEDARRVVSTTLAYVGGAKAVEALKDCYSRSGDLGVLADLSFALGSTGTPEDRQFLVETMERCLRPTGSQDDAWHNVFSSVALTLGVLREEQSMPVLEALVKLQGVESFEADIILRWINRGFFAVPVLENPTERDKVILAVLRNGLENTLDAQTAHLHEVDSNRSWLRSPDGWDVSYRDDNPDRLPRVRFDVFISSDGQRALCETGQTFGPLAGVGYDYVLRRDANEWKVVGMTMTWIS